MLVNMEVDKLYTTSVQLQETNIFMWSRKLEGKDSSLMHLQISLLIFLRMEHCQIWMLYK